MTDAAADNVHQFPAHAYRPADPAEPGMLREPPHNLDAEAALLGALMANPERVSDVAVFLQAEHFANATHGRIYAAMVALQARGDAGDATILATYLAQDGGLEAIGGVGFLHDMQNCAAGIVSHKQFGRLVRDLFYRRRLIDVGSDIINDAFDARPDSAAEDVVARAEARMADAVGDVLDDGMMFDAAEAAAVAMAPRDERGVVSFGYADLDARIGRMEPGDVVVLAGRPSMGKTALAINASLRAARDGKRVAFESLEMSAGKLGARLLSMGSRVPLPVVRDQTWTAEQALEINEARKRLLDLPLFLDCPPGLRTEQLGGRIERAKRKLGGVDLIVIDYLGLLDGEGSNGNERVTNAMKSVKRLGRRYEAPVLLLAQLSRKVEERDDKRPQLSDLRDSGAIEQDADAVILCFRESYYLERAEPVRRERENETQFWERFEQWRARLDEVRSQIDLNVAKSRQGEIGVVSLWWDGPTNRVAPLRNGRDHRQTEMEGV